MERNTSRKGFEDGPEVCRDSRNEGPHSRTEAGPIRAPLLHNLYALNRRYLDILIAAPSAKGTTEARRDRNLPESVRCSLGVLHDADLHALAQCPYTLFDFAFHEPHLWRSQRLRGQEIFDGFEGAGSKLEFARAALYFVWHAARIDVMFARFAFGMCAEVTRAVTELSVTNVACIASESMEHLAPRWPTNPCFWPDLIRFAAVESRLPAAKLLGCQLLAADRVGAVAAAAKKPTAAVRQ